MTPKAFLRDVLDYNLSFLESVIGIKSDDRARVLMLAIAGQESGWTERRQLNFGPAHGFWQFELKGGVRGVLNHPASAHLAIKLCAALSVTANEKAVHDKLIWNDRLAAGFARLLLWTDPQTLPSVGAHDEAWAYYERNWRPGKPHPDKWPQIYGQAQEAVTKC